MIKAGDRLPEGSFRVKGDDGTIKEVPVSELFVGRKAVLVGVPGAFTSTCHKAHIPTFVRDAEAIRAKGVERIAVMAVNDAHVMKAWSAALGADDGIDFLADGSGTYTHAMGFDFDLSKTGMGVRCKRLAMIVEDGTVTWLAFEPPGGGGKIVATGSTAVLEQL